jgi:hypothetical protein
MADKPIYVFYSYHPREYAMVVHAGHGGFARSYWMVPGTYFEEAN